MSLSKHQMVDLILARVGGGLPSDDLSVRAAEVVRLIPPAINYVVIGEYRIERRLNQQENSTDKTADLSSFVGTYKLPVLKDADRKLSYISIEEGLMNLPGTNAIETIFPVGGTEVSFAPIRSHVELIGVSDSTLGGQTFFWPEKFGGEDRIYFRPLSPLVKEVFARLATDFSGVDYDEALPVPDHVQMQAIQLLAEWFSGQRQMPEELIANNKDDKQR